MFVAAALAAAVSFVLATYLLELSPARIALLVGAVCGILGFGLGENVGDAIVFSLILGLLVFMFIQLVPEMIMARILIVPLATGFCVGKLVYGIWREVA